MAIKYNTSTGALHINKKAIILRDMVLKPKLSRMNCKKCGIDSEINFQQHQGYAGSGSVDWVLVACCHEFEQRVYEKLEVNR
jgi:hypothetical protein